MDWTNFLWLVILSFATYRLAQLVSDDDGPLSIFARIRQWADNKAKTEQEQGHGLIWQSVNDGLHCHFCTGVWIAIVLGVVYAGLTWYTLVYILAIAGIQSWLENFKR